MAKRILFPILLLLTLWGAPRADEGRIPIVGPVTITAPGHYFLSNNITVSSGDVIVVQANNVVIDLNGMTITNSSSTGSIIAVRGPFSPVTIQNGTLRGGYFGIEVGAQNAPNTHVQVDRVMALDQSFKGMEFLADHIQVTNSTVQGSGLDGIFAQGANGRFRGRFEGNTIIGPGGKGLVLVCGRAVEVRGNIITGHLNYGIQLSSCDDAGGNWVDGNTIRDGRTGTGDGIWVNSDGNLISNNVIRANNRGILVGENATLHSGNRLIGNVVTANRSSGIYVYGSRNMIQDNLLLDNQSFGIYFDGLMGGSGNIYRGNLIRGNNPGPVGGLVGVNTDAGANIN